VSAVRLEWAKSRGVPSLDRERSDDAQFAEIDVDHGRHDRAEQPVALRHRVPAQAGLRQSAVPGPHFGRCDRAQLVRPERGQQPIELRLVVSRILGRTGRWASDDLAYSPKVTLPATGSTNFPRFRSVLILPLAQNLWHDVGTTNCRRESNPITDSAEMAADLG
jgi:hypothetical protein